MSSESHPATTSQPTGPQERSQRAAWVVAGNRTPFARSGGQYASASVQELFTAALEGLIARAGLAGERLGAVAGGAVLKQPRSFNLVRESVLGSALDPQTPGIDVQQACATGMETTSLIANKIRCGQIEAGIAGGVDSASDAPIVVGEGLRRVLLQLNRARSTADKLKALSKLRPGDLAPVAPGVNEPRTGLSMGEHQAITTAAWGLTRQAQDEIAEFSHHRLAEAWESGFFDDLVTPFRGVTRDTNLRPDTSMEKLGGLSPVFGTSLDTEPTMTAGNSTPLTDGASAVLIATQEWAAERGLPLLAEVLDFETAAVDFVDGHEGLLMAPAYAAPRLLARNGLTLQDIDLVEIHEAFAATVLAILAAWEDAEFCRDRLGLEQPVGAVDRRRLNVHGSSLAAGHPFAATGTRIVATLAKELKARAVAEDRPVTGLISVCAAGGQGAVALLRAYPGN
ncbi:acetyl-CoA C-acetyltransferase [Kocuria coralli]|uniref:Acetyl-CoA C-acetyltransferase n=1 Tax=Kocuria coralli TaxID=1461025 RepID=A0A5J5KY20_9MICC|nr:acetyl-CoA C-acetyltransferase [Kocuria coralli]KAA9393785.1 acetyl-CoA C-acetyltransferase [Kocuria coralli]